MALPLPEATLPGILDYADKNGMDPVRTAKAVRWWQGQMRDYAHGTIAAGDPDTGTAPDHDRAWKGILNVDGQAAAAYEQLKDKAIQKATYALIPDEAERNAVLESATASSPDRAGRMDYLRTQVMGRKATELFPDPEELASFWRVWESSGKDPENMDAPESWTARARQMDAAGQQLDAAAADPAFTPTRYQSGQIGVGSNILGSYLVREKEDGSGYQAIVQPTTEGAKPITVDLPSLEAMRQQANERLAEADRKVALHDQFTDTSGGGFMGEGNVDFYGPRLYGRAAAAKSRADLLNGKDLAMALHVGLDNNLTGNEAFLDQLPGGMAAWAEQFSTRPLLQVARGLAQATAALPGTDNRALTQEGQEAVDIVAPGALANRYENSPEGNAPIADLITSGIESAVTLLLPGGLAKLGGRAMLATKVGRAGAMANTMDDVVGAAAPRFLSGRATAAGVAENAGYGTMFGTAVGQSYAATAQEADAVEATDPAKAARLRRWNGLTSLAKGAIEMGTEKIFPGEMALLKGQRIGLGSLAMMPVQETAEEGLGAVAQNAVNALTGQTMEDPVEAARGGFFGSVPFVASAALAGRFTPQPAAPTDDTAAPADPGAGPDASLFPPANANPPDFSEARPPSLLTGIAQRGGRVDSTIQDSAGVQVPTRGRSTAYGYANDETPDRNSSDGIGAWVSTAEAARIRAGEPSEMRLRPGDLAVSRDIEAQFREQGIRPGDPVTLNYADGTTHTGRWMDRTDGSLDGRFDLYSPDGPPANDGSRITGFSAGGVPGASPLSTLNPQLSTPPIPSTPEELEDGSPNLHPDGVTPDEVLAFQDAQDNYRAANPETATQPEPLRTLAAQLDLVRQGSKPSMIFEGVTRDQLPATMRPIAGRESTIDGVQTPGGYVVFNKAAIRPLVGLRVADPYTSVQAAARTAFQNPATAGQLLGYGTASKPANPTSGLVARAADGTEILAVVNDDNDPATTGQIETAINRAVAPRRALSVSAAAFRGSPLAEFVIQSGGIMSRSTARQSGMYRRSPGLWNDAPDRLADPTHNVIYGTTRPDEMAEAAVRAGLLPQGSTQRELWEALGNESSAARSTARAQRQVETDMANLERMARREDLDFTLALRAKSRRDEQRQASRQTAPPVSMAEPLPDPTDDPDYVPFARPSAPAMQFARPAAATAPDPDIEQDEEADAEDDTEMGAATGVPFPESLSELSGFGSSIPLATGRSWERGRDLKVVLQQRVRAAAAAAGVDVTKPSPEQFDYLKRVAYQDVVSALKQNPNAVGWYDIKTRQALAVVSLIHPEIKTDPVAKFSFVWALAVTSNGQKVNKNFELAERAYRAYKTTGRMPTDIDGGQAQIAINEGLDLYNKLRAEWGIVNLQKFMETTFTVKDIGSISKDLKPGGEFVATEVRGAAILGPKIGNGFFSNLYGHFDALTMDRWLVRTWGRWTGTLISEKPALTALAEIRLAEAVRSMSPAETAAMSGILGIDVTQTDAGALALRIAKVTVDKAKREAMPQTKAAQDLRRAGNSLAKYMDGQKEAPGGPGERQYIRAVFEGVLEEIRKDPKLKDMTMADMQAVLWYGEKRLYETAKKDDVDSSKDGYDDAEAPDYANAAAKLARDRGVSERSIKIALNKVANGRPAATRPTDGQAPSPIPAIPGGQPGPARDFTPREKRRFLGSLAARRQHANGRNPQSLPWNYRRDNRPDGSRARVLKSLGITYTAAWKGGSALKRTYAANGLAAPDIVELVPGDAAGAAAFAKAITASKASKFGAAVYVYPVAEYQQMRLFLTADGTSGVAVKPDGDIVSVFSSPGANAGHALMSLAVTAGGTKLDAFDTMLPAFYADHGFRVSSRLGWDDSQAPAGWDKQNFAEFNGGQPDVVFMVRDPDYQGWYDGSDGKRAASYDNALNIQQRALPKKPKPVRSAPAPAPASTAVNPARPAPAPVTRGVSPKAAEQALSLIRQSLPAVADATRIVTNREALADEMGDYRPQDWADMGPGGVQAFYDPRTGQTTIFLENIEVREGETPMRAVARIILHERIAHAGLAVLREGDPAFARQWQQLIGQIPQDQLQAIAERYPELSGNLDALAEEWLASQVEARAGQLLPSNSLAGKMWAALKTAIGRFFGKFSRSQPLDAEVDRMIFIARNALKVQFVPAGPEAATALAFSKSPFEPIGFGKRYYLAKLDAWTRGEDIGREDITLGPTPPALQIAGADKRGLTIAPSLFSKTTEGKHAVPAAALRGLPEALADPIAIFQSRTQPNALVVLTEFTEPGKGPVVVAVHLDVIDSKRTAVNRVASIHGRPASEITAMFGERPLYLHTQKSRNWLRTAGLQLPGARGFQSGSVNVPNETDVVKLAESQAPKFARPGRIKAMFLPKANQSSNLFYNGEGAYRVKSQGWRATLTGNALPKEFTALLAQGKNETAALQQAAALIGQDLNVAVAAHAKKHGLTEADVLTLVDDAMANPTTLYALQDRPLREATRKARNFLDDMSEAVATITGGQLGSAIMANRGNWMRRSYAAFDPAAGWNYDAMEKAAKAGQSIAGQPAAKIMKDARDFLQAEDPARTPGQIEAILRSLMDRTNWERALTGQGVSKPTESLMRRKELPAALRAVMGEERNPLKRYTLSAGFQAAFIARHEQQERMAQIGLQMGIFSTAREGVYTEEISDGAPTAQGQRRSGLAGLYTTPEMKAALSRAQGTTPDQLPYRAGDLVKFLLGEAKLNKVALSPDSYMVNLIGNVIGLVQTGDLLTLSAFGRIAEAIKIQNAGRPIAALGAAQAVLRETRRAHLARITAAGVADSSYSIADLQSSLDNKTLQFIEADNRWNRLSGAARGAVLGQGLGRIFGATGQGIGAVTGAAVGTALGGKRIVDAQRQIAQWTLGAPDRFGKIMAFQNNYEAHLASGMSDQAAFDLATEKTLDTMPDYSKLPELFKQLSQLGVVGSFIGFQVEVYRNAYHNFRYAAKELASGKPALMALGARRLIGASTVQALALGGFQAIIAGIFGQGASDDEDEAYRRSLAKPYEKFGRLAYTALDGEKAAYFNTSYLLPQVTMWEITRAALSGDSFETALENAVVAGKNQIAGGGVHTDPLLEAVQNARKDGRPVSTETGYRQGAERVLYYLRRAIEPGAIDKLDRIARALDNRDRNSRTFTLKEEGLRLLGVRQTTYKHTETIKSRLYELDGAYNDAAATARTSWKDNAPGARAAAITRANTRIAGIRADYEQFTKDLTTLRLLPLLQTVNDNRSADGTRRPILPKEFKPLVDTPDGPKPMSSK